MSRRTHLNRAAFLVFAAMFFTLVPHILFADPISIQGVGASHQKLANGNIRLHFTVRVNVLTPPLVYNYHWERSDGAKSAVKVESVKKGVTSIAIRDTWDIGPKAGVTEVWEQLFINTGNTHLISEQIKIAVPK